MRAQAAFEAAISLAPNHAPLRLWYGDFLSRQLHESQAAIQQYEHGLKIEPGSPHILMALARAQIFRRHFDEAWANLQRLGEMHDLPPRLVRRFIDIRLRYFIRKADFEAAKDDMPSCLGSIKQFQEHYEKLDENLVDRKAKEKIIKVFSVLTELQKFYAGTPRSAEIEGICEWFYSRFGEYSHINRGGAITTHDTDLVGLIHSCKGN